jgi:hypothetical protein
MSINVLSTAPIGALALNTTTNTLGINTSNGMYHLTNNSNGSAVSFVTKEEFDKRLDKIEKRLAILVPDPLKLQKYETLRKAYEHYKMLEILLEEQNG